MNPARCFALLLGLILTIAASAAETYTIAVVPMGTTHQYWKQIHAGALKAQAELQAEGVPVELIWKGPLREDDRDQQVQVVENFMTRRVSGIVLAPLDARALAAPVEQAVAAGIPVVIVDSPLSSKAPVSTIATDNYAGGRLAGRRLGELLGAQGNVILLRVQVGSASCEARESGFLDELAEKFPGIKVISSNQHGGATRNTALGVSQNLLTRFGREVDGIFAPNESTLAGMLLALKDAGLGGGRVKLVGFANSAVLVDALRSNDLHGLVLQDPVKMGYLGVKSVVQVLRGEKVPALVDTGVAIATLENLGEPGIAGLIGGGEGK
ncbi:MAG: substrate-binding domain-containing protein [Opitutaceae bacterium]|nr:substrate-binding domain-containing protein [Opitutaceae bacterium]MBP9913657.1 substrate-binding domain-containing protein [Opitutaceae bacterium]